jgi:hypothetical protein
MRKKRPRPRGATIKGQASQSWEVSWHAEAKKEHQELEAGDRVAVQHAVEKLKVDGVKLREPHQKAIMGKAGAGLRELRPNSGKCPWRPIYRQFGPRLFVILAVGPEVNTDKQGYDRAVRHAQDRVPKVEKLLGGTGKKKKNRR